MLKCLYYLGRPICSFDDEALGKTWCYSVVVRQVIAFCGRIITHHMIYILIGRIFIICSLYDLYSHWENLYHLARCIIYIPFWGIPAWGICIILLVVWFIFPLGEFVLFCPSHVLYSHWENLYHLTRSMIYIPTWGICIICLLPNLYSH